MRKYKRYKWAKSQKTALKQAVFAVFISLAMFILALSTIHYMAIHPEKRNEESHQVDSQRAMTRLEFINYLTPAAQKNQKTYHVLSSISLAQAILESDWGRSDLAKERNNLYGIKGGNEDPNYLTQEFNGENFITVDEPFRTYNSFEESMEDHAVLLVNGTTYNPQIYHEVLYASNYQEAAYALQNAGYATDPNYASKLIGLIEEYRLHEFD